MNKEMIWIRNEDDPEEERWSVSKEEQDNEDEVRELFLWMYDRRIEGFIEVIIECNYTI